MALPDIRQRTGYLFLIVAVGHIILISAQVTSRSDTGTSLLQENVFRVFSALQWATSRVTGGVESLWTSYAALRDARGENVELRRQMADLQVQLQQARATAEESRRLAALLDLKSEHGDLKTVGARVIAGSPTTDVRTFTIDKGFRDDVVKDLAVMVPSGVVGRVMTTASHTASVQVLLDRSAAAAARLEKSREQCIVLGIGEETLRIDYLSAAARPEPGETVLTSGLDGIYPEGLLIGKVETVDVKRRTYTVRPAASFSTLEEVLVVLTRPAVAGPRGRGQ